MNIQAYMKKNKLSQAAFGKQVGVAQSMVNQWLHGRRRIGAERAVIIEKKTGGVLNRKSLRPDIFA